MKEGRAPPRLAAPHRVHVRTRDCALAAQSPAASGRGMPLLHADDCATGRRVFTLGCATCWPLSREASRGPIAAFRASIARMAAGSLRCYAAPRSQGGAIVALYVDHRMRHSLAHRVPCAACVAAGVRPSAARYVVVAAAGRPPLRRVSGDDGWSDFF
ncbi:hypothetical protein F511_40715 [Dorcoceras hygrometricum]|uniref:Uncharacterized protein n=1 Tax=Dorcoceras hygrometricum TaxID=472368 RepID=A0A2Z7B0A1_9LAMI|nr:hypothetical protein F511_40715 [Dorcoceras hygrometricum]